MVSAPSTRVTPGQTTSSQPPPWPGSGWARFGFKALLAAPLAVLGLIAVANGHVSVAHQALIDHTALVTADGFTFNDIGNFYPPAPIMITLLVGSSAAGLAVASSLLAGSALHSAWERMVQREVPHATQLTMLCAITLIPSVWYLAGQDVATIGGLTMLVVALAGFVRFVYSGDTVGGFTAGLFLAAAFLFDPAALAYALTLALATPFLASMRQFREPAALRALIAVLCFPIVAVILGWGFIEWRFDGSWFAFLTTDLGLFQWDVSALSALWDSVLSVGRDVLFVPIYLAVAFLLMRRKPLIGAVYLIPVAGLVLVRWVGLFYSATATLILLTFLAMGSAPRDTSKLVRWLLPAAAIAQLVMNVALPPETPGFHAWFSSL